MNWILKLKYQIENKCYFKCINQNWIVKFICEIRVGVCFFRKWTVRNRWKIVANCLHQCSSMLGDLQFEDSFLLAITSYAQSIFDKREKNTYSTLKYYFICIFFFFQSSEGVHLKLKTIKIHRRTVRTRANKHSHNNDYVKLDSKHLIQYLHLCKEFWGKIYDECSEL